MHTHARVEEGVEDVGEEVDEDEEDADEEDGPHDDGEVVFVQPVDDDDAHAFPVEDVLDKDGTGQQTGEPAGGGGDNGVEGDAEGMAEDDAAAGKAFGAGSADEVLREGFEHTVARQLGEGGEGADAEGEGGEDEVFEVEVLAGAVVVDGVEVAEHVEVRPVGKDVGEEPGNEDGCKKGGQRHAKGGEEEGQAVNTAVLMKGGEDAQKEAHHKGKG